MLTWSPSGADLRGIVRQGAPHAEFVRVRPRVRFEAWLTSAPLPLLEDLMRQVPWGRFFGWARRLALVPLVLAGAMLLFGYQARMRLVDQGGSYCRHLDEHLWTKQAIRMLKTGDLNPRRFTKPSVMVYLDTAGLALGLLKTGMKGKEVPAIQALRESAYPFYTSASMVRTVRQLYALLSVAAMGMVGLLARHLFRKMHRSVPFGVKDERQRSQQPFVSAENAVGLLALGIALVSEFYLRYGHLYLGVDILGSFFALLAISYFVLAPPSTRSSTFAIVAGIVSGLCMGTKYNLYPIMVPALLGIVFRHRTKLVSSLALFCSSVGLTFIATTPYAILDLPHFVGSAVAEAAHYARGHGGGHSATPGASLFLAYGRPVLTAYGPVLVLFALVGAATSLRRAPKQALLVLSYPLLLWVYMSGQRVIFTRNLLVLQLILPIFAALGAVATYRAAHAFILERGGSERVLRAVVPALVLVTLSTVPWKGVVGGYLGPVESRTELARWFEGRPETTVLVPKEIEFDARSLERKKVVMYEARDARLPELRRKHPGALVVAPVFEGKAKAPKGPKSDILWSGGKNRVQVSPERFSGSFISDGNPRIVVYRNPWAIPQ